MSGSLDSALLLASAPWSLRANRLTLYGRAAVFGQCTQRQSGHLIYHSDGGGYEREGGSSVNNSAGITDGNWESSLQAGTCGHLMS